MVMANTWFPLSPHLGQEKSGSTAGYKMFFFSISKANDDMRAVYRHYHRYYSSRSSNSSVTKDLFGQHRGVGGWTVSCMRQTRHEQTVRFRMTNLVTFWGRTI